MDNKNWSILSRKEWSTCIRIQAIKLKLAIWQILWCLLIFSSWYFNPISTNNITVNHEAEGKENIAFICHKALHTKAINVYALIKNTCKWLGIVKRLKIQYRYQNHYAVNNLKEIIHVCITVTSIKKLKMLTTTAGYHCWQCNYNLQKRMWWLLLVIHNAPFLNHFYSPYKFGHLTVPIHLLHPPLKHPKQRWYWDN